MSMYGLIKETSRIQRGDTITDIHRVNKFLLAKGLPLVNTTGPSLRRLENAVALSIKDVTDFTDFPKLERGVEFYISILPEIIKIKHPHG